MSGQTPSIGTSSASESSLPNAGKVRSPLESKINDAAQEPFQNLQRPIPSLLMDAVVLSDWTAFKSIPKASVIDLHGRMIFPHSEAIAVKAAQRVLELMQTDDPQLSNAWEIFDSSVCREFLHAVPIQKIKPLVTPIFAGATFRGLEKYAIVLERRFPVIFPANND